MPVKKGLHKEDSREWTNEDSERKRYIERKLVDVYAKALEKLEKMLNTNKSFPSAEIIATMKIGDTLKAAKLAFTPNSRATPELKKPTEALPVDPTATLAHLGKENRTIDADDLYTVDTERLKKNNE